MDTKLTSKTDTKAEFTVTLNADRLTQIKGHVFDAHLRPKVKAAGFRPGKAPDSIVERELGPAAVQNQVIDEAIQESYSGAIRELELPVVASPQVTIQKFVPYTELEYSVEVELMPPVDAGDYKSIRIKRPSVKVEAAEIEQTLNDLRRREASRVVVERGAKLGDEVLFDFAGSRDGQPVQGATATGQTLMLGSGTFIPGFEDQLVGLKPGDSKTFTIEFPKEYHESSLAGQPVEFKVTVKTVTELALPELNEELVAKVSPFKTVTELKTDISEKLTASKTEQSAKQYEAQVLEAVLKAAKYQLPDALVKQQLARNLQELEQNLAYSGLDLAKYLDLSNKSQEQLETEMRPEAERRVALAMVLTEVAKAEKIEVKATELDAEIDRLKQDYPDAQTQAELDKPSTREEVYNHLMASRVIAKLTSYAEKS